MNDYNGWFDGDKRYFSHKGGNIGAGTGDGIIGGFGSGLGNGNGFNYGFRNGDGGFLANIYRLKSKDVQNG